MKQISFETFLEYKEKETVIKSDFLKTVCNSLPNMKAYKGIKMIANEIPLKSGIINDTIKMHFDEIEYIEIMSNSQFYMKLV